MAKANGILDMPVEEREVQVGDEILAWVLGRTRRVRITKVTKMYVWFEYTTASSGRAHNTKRIRGITLLHSKYY